MKKFLCLALALTICFSLVACGNDEKPNDNNNNSESTAIQNEDANNSNKENDYTSDKDLPGIIRVNLSTVKYCVDAPGTLSQRANTGHIVEMGSYFVVYDQYVDISSEKEFGVDKNSISNADDVIGAMSKQMAATCRNGLIFADDYKVEVANSENKKVNSWDMCKVSGSIKLSCEFPLDYESVDFVAYSLIKDGFPVYFAVVENPAGDNPIDLGTMADKIAKTFREYSED